MNKADVYFTIIFIGLVLIALVIGAKKETVKHAPALETTTYKLVIETHKKGTNPLDY